MWPLTAPQGQTLKGRSRRSCPIIEDDSAALAQRISMNGYARSASYADTQKKSRAVKLAGKTPKTRGRAL